MSGSQEFGQCVEWCPMCRAESERLGGQGPADGAPSPDEPLTEAEREAFAKRFAFGASAFEFTNDDALRLWSSLRAVERERDAATELFAEVLGYFTTPAHPGAACWSAGMMYDQHRKQYYAELARLRALSPGAATTESEGTHG